MLIGSDGTGWIKFDNYELARTIGVVALALILFEGGLTPGLVEIRPVLGTAVALALIATPDHRGDRGPRRRVAVRLRHRARPAGRRGAGEHRRRGDLRAAAQLDAAAAVGARARGRVRPQRPGRRAAGARADPVHQRPDLRLRRRRAAARAPARDRHAGRRGGRLARQCRRSDARSSRPPGSTRWRRWRSPRSRSAAPTRCTARASSPSTSPGSRSGRPRIPAQQTITAFHQGLAWVAQVGDVPHARPARLPAPAPRHRAGGDRARADRGGVARPLAVFPATLVLALRQARADRARLGGPARGGAGGAGDVPGDRRGARQPRAVQHRLLRGAASRRCCRARRSSRWPRVSA